MKKTFKKRVIGDYRIMSLFSPIKCLVLLIAVAAMFFLIGSYTAGDLSFFFYFLATLSSGSTILPISFIVETSREHLAIKRFGKRIKKGMSKSESYIILLDDIRYINGESEYSGDDYKDDWS